jgi:hypothetical protein
VKELDLIFTNDDGVVEFADLKFSENGRADTYFITFTCDGVKSEERLEVEVVSRVKALEYIL